MPAALLWQKNHSVFNFMTVWHFMSLITFIWLWQCIWLILCNCFGKVLKKKRLIAKLLYMLSVGPTWIRPFLWRTEGTWWLFFNDHELIYLVKLLTVAIETNAWRWLIILHFTSISEWHINTYWSHRLYQVSGHF